MVDRETQSAIIELGQDIEDLLEGETVEVAMLALAFILAKIGSIYEVSPETTRKMLNIAIGAQSARPDSGEHRAVSPKSNGYLN